jgi:ubiquinone/menaquinone biosynthesis C-methylase UbiE
MSEAKIYDYIIDAYDEVAFMPELVEYFEQSDYLNFGYWDKNTANQKQACENLMEQLLSFIPEKSGTVLDVACGKGATTAYLLKYYPAKNITGINISERQLEKAQSNAPGCTFLLMNATELDFASGSFDSIICVEAAFHFYTREKFLKEALRVLKRGGRLVLSDILMNLEAEKNRNARTEKNYIRDVAEYQEILRGVGFQQVEVVDATEACWKSHFRYAVRYLHEKFLSREIDRNQLEKSLLLTYQRVPDMEYYLLAAGSKP